VCWVNQSVTEWLSVLGNGGLFAIADTEGEYTLSFEEQCDALYNLACAAALAGQQDNASKALHQLEQVDAISAKDLSEDSDLKGLQVQDWFVEMIQRLTPSKEQSKE
jgi:hypothetical protein